MKNIIDKYKILFEEAKINYTESESILQAYCPFHNDTKPSLSVNKRTGLYNCFSTKCDLGGGTYDKLEKKIKELYQKKDIT